MFEIENNIIVRGTKANNWVKNGNGISSFMKIVTYYLVPLTYVVFTLFYFVIYFCILFPETLF